jgi:hypothetical protein
MIFLVFAAPDSRTELWRVSGEAVTEFHKKNRCRAQKNERGSAGLPHQNTSNEEIRTRALIPSELKARVSERDATHRVAERNECRPIDRKV